MPTDAHRQRNKRYKETKEQIVVLVPKGAREGIKRYASSLDKSMNAYIVDLVERDIGCSLNDFTEKNKSTQD